MPLETQLTKGALDRAGDVLRNDNSDNSDRQAALRILSIRRLAHVPALTAFRAVLLDVARSRSGALAGKERDAFVALRLKCLASIELKLRRLKTRLSRMQDLAGLRVVLPTVEDVRAFHEALLKADVSAMGSMSSMSAESLPAKDYIASPKADGYRSIHQVFRCRSETASGSPDLYVEVQIRTRLQRAWATAVETYGAIERMSLKTGEGPGEAKRFFALASALLSHKEGMPVREEFAGLSPRELGREFSKLEAKLGVFDTLARYVLEPRDVIGEAGDYTLMCLDLARGELTLTPFEAEEAASACDRYLLTETRYRGDASKLVVLVSAESTETGVAGDHVDHAEPVDPADRLGILPAAYPNYVLDARPFVEAMRSILAEVR